MSKRVFWIVEGMIREGAYDALVSLMDEMVTSTQVNEPGTMAYEWFWNSGKDECRIFEEYRDSAAAMIHLRTFDEKFAERLGQLMQINRLTLYGEAEKELIEALRGDGTAFFSPVGGFTR